MNPFLEAIKKSCEQAGIDYVLFDMDPADDSEKEEEETA